MGFRDGTVQYKSDNQPRRFGTEIVRWKNEHLKIGCIVWERWAEYWHLGLWWELGSLHLLSYQSEPPFWFSL